MPESKPTPTKESFLKTLHDDQQRHHDEYTKRFGNVLNADNAATLFDDYNADPAKHRVPVHEAASEIRDSLFEKKLAESAPEGKDAVVFTAGGNASGKSTIADLSKAGDAAHVVLDSTFSNTDHARSLVDKALTANKPVLIQHVVRPIGEAFRGMLERAKTEGRVVSIRQMLNSERGALATVRDLQQEFADDPRVQFQFFDNSGAAPRETAAPPELKGYAESKAELHDILDSEYRQGRISEELYHRIGGSEINRGTPEVQGGERPESSGGIAEATPGAVSGAIPEQRNEGSLAPTHAPEPSAAVPDPDPAPAKPTTLGYGALSQQSRNVLFSKVEMSS